MGISKNKIKYLLEIYSSGKATTTEEQELFNWVAKGNEKPVKKHIENLLSTYKSNEEIPSVDWDHLYQNIIEVKNSRNTQPILRKMTWPYWAAAAVVLLLMGSAYYFLTAFYKEGKNMAIAKAKKNDIAPPKTANAILVLSNGKQIILNGSGNGMLAVQGSVKIDKQADGQIVYHGTNNDVQYNTLINPRGSRVVSLTLADGSNVFLNAASSLRYPTAFSGNERKVEVTGEAYFEVAHNPAMPFMVSNGSTKIKVLGTHFDVNAYDDENTLNVTLLEGKVSVMSMDSRQAKGIIPGEQAEVDKHGNIELNKSVDLIEIMAWKNGIFSFKGDNIETIMRQISRWYNVDVVFEKQLHEKFYADVSRNTSVSTLLEMLEATKAVHFIIEGKTIKVMPTSP